LIRPRTVRNHQSRRSSSPLTPLMIGCAHSGTATSKLRPTSTPKKPGALTPRIGNE
jgi:hypothetical protein